MRAFRELCVVLIFVHFGQHTPVVRTSIHLEADAGPMFRDNIHLVDHFLSGVESGLSSLSSGYPWDNNASHELHQGTSCVIASILILLILTHRIACGLESARLCHISSDTHIDMFFACIR